MYLARAIDSALSQTVPPKEVIVVDDGSEVPVASNFPSHDRRIRFIRYEGGVNANFARNYGIGLCKTKYVALLDSDDWWADTHLENAMLCMKESKSVLIFGAYFAVSFVGVEGSTIVRPRRRLLEFETPSAFLFLGGGNARTSTFVCEVDFAAKVKFDECLEKHQDWDFIVRAQINGVVGFNPEPTVFIDHQAVERMTATTNLQATYRFYSSNRDILSRAEQIAFFLRVARHSLEIGDCSAAREILRWVDMPLSIQDRFRWGILRMLAVHPVFPGCIIATYGVWLSFRSRIKSLFRKMGY